VAVDDVDSLIAELQAVVDVDTTAALRLLNRRHRQMVARGRCYRTTVDFGLSVADQSGYAFPASPPIVELQEVTVDGVPYGKARRDDWYSYSQGALTWTGPPGLWFAEEDSTLVLTPAPGSSGLAIVGAALALPPDLVSGGAVTTLKVDLDLLDALVEGAAATELFRIGEGDPVSLETKFDSACDEQRRRARRRNRGSGTTQIRIQGVNA
jgi:hypothetical protein